MLSSGGSIFLGEDALEGAWARDGRRFGEGPLEEPATVLWLTASPFFCDLRVFEADGDAGNALDATQAFSGVVSVDGDTVTWSHDLDTTDRPVDHADTARIEGTGDELTEIGEGYEERWVRITPTSATVAVAERLSERSDCAAARMIVVGEHAIGVWSEPTPGAVLLERGAQWTVARAIGDAVDRAESLAVAQALEAYCELPGRWARIR